MGRLLSTNKDATRIEISDMKFIRFVMECTRTRNEVVQEKLGVQSKLDTVKGYRICKRLKFSIDHGIYRPTISV